MPNQRKATFMVSSMPNSPMNAGRNAVMGMERMGAATGSTRSLNQRKLAMSSPSGMATTADHRNAWPMRNQLAHTFDKSPRSEKSKGNARKTPMGLGKT